MTTATPKIKHDISTAEGYEALLQAEINITLNIMNYPHFTVIVEDWGITGMLSIKPSDFVLVDMADAKTLAEALAVIRYQQEFTATPLYVDREFAALLNANIGTITNTFSDEQGKLIDFTEIPHLH
jgi:hypothetical protein